MTGTVCGACRRLIGDDESIPEHMNNCPGRPVRGRVMAFLQAFAIFREVYKSLRRGDERGAFIVDEKGKVKPDEPD